MMVYFDNSATTRLSSAAREAMINALDCFGNPSSLHALGLEAERIISSARKTILSTLGVKCSSSLDARQLIFTASGTEADNLALIGVASAKDFPKGKKILTSDSEHPAVLEALSELERRGFEVIKIPTRGGVLDLDEIERTADRDTILASFMLVNNETGALYDVKRAFEIVKSKNRGAVTHTDCVQGYLKHKFTAKSLGADMITLSAHKIGGPKGVGALYVSSEILTAKKLVPIVYGGGQERGMRSGTENVLGIAGFAAAAESGFASLTSDLTHMSNLREYLLAELADERRFAGVTPNLPKESHAPHILSLTLPGIRSETMLHSLSAQGVYVSSGSACSSNTGHASYVLSAFGLDAKSADSTVRISLAPENTREECDVFLSALEKSLVQLVRR